jgi:flagellum-specific ATP synthase
VASSAHIDAARRFRQLHARHNKARDLIQLGAYSAGHDHDLDTAVRLHEPMTALLQQSMHQSAALDASVQQLRDLINS